MALVYKQTPEQELPMRLGQGHGASISLDSLAPDIQELAKKPDRVMCGTIDMHIDCHGQWFYKGSIIARPEMVKLFASVLHRDDLGHFWMVTPAEMAQIHVDDAPFTAVELITEGEGETMTAHFRTNTDAVIPLNTEHPLHIRYNPSSQEPRPYVTVRDRLEALINRPSFYELIHTGCEITMKARSVLGVWSFGTFFPIGPMDDSPADDIS